MSSSNTSSLFNTDTELFTIGIVYVVLTVIVFPVYGLLIYALNSESELKENISYKLLNLLNYCDVSQSFCHFLTGIFLIFPIISEKAQFFVRIVGCTANSLWLATFIIMAVLAITRIGVAFFHIKATKWSGWMIVALGIGFTYILVVWMIGCVTQNFELTGPSWSYDMTVEYASLLANLELVLCFPTLALSFFSYILIISSICKKRNIAQSSSSSIFRTEVGILVQATILTAYMAILITLWHNADSWFKMRNFTLASLNCGWILFSHLNLVLLISINKGVRSQILKLLCSKKVPRQTSNLVPVHVSSTAPVES
ncbi:Serpentine Receptor, class T [Caenorhabditis elegans]|uniref:Serpentine Receptor, class T n=1 Tax=Caenorhabditis elegans TaxID=6239 RepID=P91511_CAEEL|nr:Serpentine Receptor, class T [Caenorhabditis elegans]CCD70571.1 Serpentine Receptor, class T [Caenorhabditis elegans]|eukprot:NP_503894.2 Serpentine Receptor, class T [Caenorhabditis elegans]